MAAATQLLELGWRVTLFERSRILGGRSASFWDERFGEWLDHGPHIFIGAYRATMGLLRRWGSADLISFADGRDIPWLLDGGRRAQLRLGRSRAGAAWGMMLFSVLRLSERIAVLRGVRALAAYFPPYEAGGEQGGVTYRDAPDGRGETVAALLRKADADRGGAGEFFEALTLAVMNSPTPVAAAAPMAAALREGLLMGGDAARIGLPTRPLKEIVGDAAQTFLAREGAELRLSEEVSSLRRTAEGSILVEISSGYMQTEAVILAVPPADLRPILPRDETQNIFISGLDDFRYAPIAGVHFVFDRPLLRSRFGYLAKRYGQWVFGRGAAEDGGWRRVSVVISNAEGAKARISTGDIVERVLDGLRERLPEANSARVLNSRAVRTARATVVLTPELLPRRGAVRSPWRGIYLAGDWCATGLPATIESAVRSGMAAADAAGEDYGKVGKWESGKCGFSLSSKVLY